MIELCADRYGWAAGAQREALNRLFWSKLNAAGRCWCEGTLLPYKPSETIHSQRLRWAAKKPPLDSITAQTPHGEPVGERRGSTYCSSCHLPKQRVCARRRCKQNENLSSARYRCNPIHECNPKIDMFTWATNNSFVWRKKWIQARRGDWLTCLGQLEAQRSKCFLLVLFVLCLCTWRRFIRPLHGGFEVCGARGTQPKWSMSN